MIWPHIISQISSCKIPPPLHGLWFSHTGLSVVLWTLQVFPPTLGICTHCSLFPECSSPDIHDLQSHSLQVFTQMSSFLKRTSVATLSKISYTHLMPLLWISFSSLTFITLVCVCSFVVWSVGWLVGCLSPPLNCKLCEERNFYPFCPFVLQAQGTVVQFNVHLLGTFQYYHQLNHSSGITSPKKRLFFSHRKDLFIFMIQPNSLPVSPELFVPLSGSWGIYSWVLNMGSS